MAGGKENFFTKEEEEDTFPSLTFLAARLVYYINLICCMYNIRKAIINPFQCKCDDYCGCCLPNGIRDYCDVCFLFTKHNPSDNEHVFKIKDIIRKNIELVNDMKKYNIDIDTYDYQFVTFNRLEIYSFWFSVFYSERSFIRTDTFY